MQKPLTLSVVLCAYLVPVVAAPQFVGKDEEVWLSEAFDAVLTESSTSHCSLIFLMDSTSSYMYETSRFRGYRSKSGGDVVFEVADNGDVNLTMTQVVAQARWVRLMSWCVLVVILSDNPTYLSTFAEVSDKGRLMVWETRLLVVTRLPMPILENLLQNYWIFSMMNTVFLKSNATWEENHCQIYGYMPYSPTGAQVMQLASLRSGRVLVNIRGRALFPEKYKNFYGMKMNLTWIPITPYWMPVKRPGPNGTEVSTFTGREYWIMESMASFLNFSLNPLPYRGWNSVMKPLRTREALIWPVNLPILPHMLEHYDFSFFLERSTLAFAMAKPSTKARWQSLYYPLRVDVWGFILATVIVVYIVLMVMNQIERDKEAGAWLVMKQVLGTLLDEAIPGELPHRSTTRMVLTAWLIFCFVVGTVYRSNLTASLTVIKEPLRIESLAGLVDAETKILVRDNMQHFYDNFKQSSSEVLQTIAARMEIVPNYVDGMTRCLTENAVYLYERLFMEVKVAEDFTDSDQSTPLYVTQESLLADFSAFLLIRDAPFKPLVDYCLITFQGAGLIGKWRKDIMDEIRSESRQKRRQEESADVKTMEGKIKPLTIVHMQGPLFLYLALVIVSLVSFFSETFLGVCLHQQTKQNKTKQNKKNRMGLY